MAIFKLRSRSSVEIIQRIDDLKKRIAKRKKRIAEYTEADSFPILKPLSDDAASLFKDWQTVADDMGVTIDDIFDDGSEEEMGRKPYDEVHARARAREQQEEVKRWKKDPSGSYVQTNVPNVTEGSYRGGLAEEYQKLSREYKILQEKHDALLVPPRPNAFRRMWNWLKTYFGL